MYMAFAFQHIKGSVVISISVIKRPGTRKTQHTKKRVASNETTLHLLVAEAGLEPHDLRVMSPASYQLLHSAISIACT